MSTTTIGAIVWRDGGTCCYCAKQLIDLDNIKEDDSKRFTFDHVHPRSKGGKWKPENLVMACVGCNSSKGDAPITDPDLLAEIERRTTKKIDRKMGRVIGDKLYPWAQNYRKREAEKSLARYHDRKGKAMANVNKILVVDLSHRFWSTVLGGGLPDSTSPRDMVVQEIRSIAKGGGYDRIVIAADGKAKSFRSALWPEYKAKRSQREERFWRLLDDTINQCDLAGWHVMRAPEHPDYQSLTYEADDVIGTVVTWAKEKGIKADIFSGDGDLTQLVDDSFGVRMLRAYKGTTVLNESGVRAWQEVAPCMVADLKALMGDDGDGYGNIFPGVGIKAALQMLDASSGSAVKAIEIVLASTKDTALVRGIKGIEGGALARVKIGLRLAQLCIDVPLDLESIMSARESRNAPSLTGDLVPPDPAPAPSNAPASAPPPPVDDVAIVGEIVPAAPAQDTSSAAIVVHENPDQRMLIAPKEARQRLLELKAFISHVLIKDVDYGVIPGCGSKPALMLSGAQKISEVYGYYAVFEEVRAIEKWADGQEFFFYKYRCKLMRKSDGMPIAECIASANSKETKWGSRWVEEKDIPDHLLSNIEGLKKRNSRRKWDDKGGKFRKGDLYVSYQVPNEEICNQVNTICKMAQKRAYVGAVLQATRASGIFAADIDNIPPEALGLANDKAQWDLEGT